MKEVDRVLVDIPDEDLEELEMETIAVLEVLEEEAGSMVRLIERTRNTSGENELYSHVQA